MHRTATVGRSESPVSLNLDEIVRKFEPPSTFESKCGHATNLSRLLSCLAGWPREVTTGEDVQMDVENALPRPGAVVHDEPKVLAMARGLRDFRRRERELAGEGLVVKIAELLDVAAWDHQNMKRRARVVVLERDDVGVLVNDRRRDLLRGDLAEDAVGHVRNLAP